MLALREWMQTTYSQRFTWEGQMSHRRVHKLPRKGANYQASCGRWGHELPGKEPPALARQTHPVPRERELAGAQSRQGLSEEAEEGCVHPLTGRKGDCKKLERVHSSPWDKSAGISMRNRIKAGNRNHMLGIATSRNGGCLHGLAERLLTCFRCKCAWLAMSYITSLTFLSWFFRRKSSCETPCCVGKYILH